MQNKKLIISESTYNNILENLNDFQEELNIPFEDFMDKILSNFKLKYGYNFIGEGANGFAFDVGGDKILKITWDKSEAKYANMLKNIESPNLIKIYNVKRIVLEDSEFYVILMEKLDTNVNHYIKSIFYYLNLDNNLSYLVKQGVKPKVKDILNYLQDKFVSLSDENILMLFNIWYKVASEVISHGFPIDDMTKRNIGISKRNPKEIVFFDITDLYSLGGNDGEDIQTIDI